MKNINVKKVVAGAAALALGVGVLGVAIAGNNSGDTFGPVVKGDVYTPSTMQPKVSIVTGVAGDDEQWALNIANAIATSAKKRNPQYDAWVPSGGSTTVTGDGKEFDDDDLAIGAEATKIIDYRHYSLLGDYKVRVNTAITSNNTDEIKIKDKIGLTTKIDFDDDKRIADLTASIYRRGIDYNIEFNPSIKNGANDSGSRDLKFSIMGKEYTMESWNGTKLTLVQNKATTPYSEGDSFAVGNHTVVVNNILDTGVYTEAYEVELQLKDSTGAVVSTEVYEAGDEIFEEFLDISVEIAKVYSTRVTVISGTSIKLELSDGLIDDFPEKDDELWHVKLHKDASNNLTKIQIFNNESETQWKDKEALRIGDEVALPYDFAKFKFVGLTEEDTKTVTVEDGYIKYTDQYDDDHKVFFYEQDKLTINQGDTYTTSQTIDDHKLHFTFYTADVPDANTNIVYSGGDGSTGQEGYFTVQLDNKDGDFLTAGNVSGGGTWTWGTNTVTDLGKFAYGTIADDDGKGFTNIQIPLYNNESEKLTYGVFIAEDDSDERIEQVGIALKAGQQGSIEGATQFWSIGKTYYAISTGTGESSATSYVGAASVDANPTSITETDVESMFEFIVNDALSKVTAHIDAYTGDLVDTDDTDYKTGLRQVLGDNANLNQKDTDDLRWAYTNFGTKYEVDGGKFMATVPDQALNAKIFIGGGTTVIDDSDETNPYPKYITTNVVANDLLKKDTPMEVSGTLIVVGGHLVNKSAEGITENFLVEEADHIMGKHTNGNIYVAGWTKADTGRAASELVNVITSWPIE